MAIKSGLFNSVNGDRRYKADFFAEYFASFIGNGVFPHPATGLQVITNDDMSVNIRAGQAWIYGYYFSNDSNYNLQLDIADGVLKRIDRIILQLNYLNRDIVPIVKKGTPASSPVAPTLKRDADAYEIALADIAVNNGAISISQANITDLRFIKELCGIVKGTVDQIDTTDLFAQYDAEFHDWLKDVQSALPNSAKLVSVEDNANYFKTHTVEEVLKELFDNQTDQFRITRSDKDINDVFRKVTVQRLDGKKFADITLSGGESPRYTNRSVKFYAPNGVDVVKEQATTIEYDEDGNWVVS